MITLKTLFFLTLLLSLSVISSGSIASNNQQFLLQKIAQAPQLKKNTSSWVQLIEQPGNSQYYYLANDQGKIYQLTEGKPKHTVLLLDIKQLHLKSSIIKLNAFTLHPNFSLRGQDGYGTFYTAHIEKSTNNKTPRLREKTINKSLPYDAVLTEWQLNLAKEVDNSKRREIFKVAIPTIKHGITQLSFNPYSESWQDDFSQLYIALSQSPQLTKHPLYSGTILRINPQSTATRNYSVPNTNPFYSHKQIEQSIYLLGAGQIKQFIWPDKYAKALLVSHQYLSHDTNKHWLSYSQSGEDWRKNSPQQFSYQTDQPVVANRLLVYRGQNAPLLRNKLLLLLKDKTQWKITSLSSDVSSPDHIDNKTQKPLNSPQLEWQLPQEVLITHQLTLHRGNHGELLFFNEDTGAIYQLFQTDIDEITEEAPQSSLVGITLFFLVVLALFGGYIFYQIKVHHIFSQYRVKKEFWVMSLNNDKLSLNLSRRLQNEKEKVIAFTNIQQCQVLIGDVVITTVDTTFDHGFNNQKDLLIREILHTEQIAKMVDNKIRRINLVINTNDKAKYVICLYLRKGSDRITQNSYSTVVDDIIDWCWLIADKINHEQTEKRDFKPKRTADDIARAEHKTHDDTPLYKQAAVIRSATHLINKVEIKALEPLSENTDEQVIDKNTNDVTLFDQNDSTIDTNTDTNIIETDLANGLETAVKLHQQGYLSAEEFVLAKAELLNSFNRTEGTFPLE